MRRRKTATTKRYLVGANQISGISGHKVIVARSHMRPLKIKKNCKNQKYLVKLLTDICDLGPSGDPSDSLSTPACRASSPLLPIKTSALPCLDIDNNNKNNNSNDSDNEIEMETLATTCLLRHAADPLFFPIKTSASPCIVKMPTAQSGGNTMHCNAGSRITCICF